MNKNEPLISCLCVTYKKIGLLPRAIDCFRNQTYSNKELWIFYQDDDLNTKRYVDSIQDVNIHSYEIKSDLALPLGAKRNLAVGKSNGIYFCNWDDDDWYHNQRLEIQMDAIQENYKEASILMYIIFYDAVDHQAYMSFPWIWEGTLLCKRSLFENFTYQEDLNKGEDSHFLLGLLNGNYIYPVIKPTLYIYTYHGNNTWDYQHFKSFYSRSQKLSDEASKFIKKTLEDNVNYGQPYLMSEQDLLKEVDYLRWARQTLQSILNKS